MKTGLCSNVWDVIRNHLHFIQLNEKTEFWSVTIFRYGDLVRILPQYFSALYPSALKEAPLHAAVLHVMSTAWCNDGVTSTIQRHVGMSQGIFTVSDNIWLW